MPVVRFSNAMKYYVDNQGEFFIPGVTIGEVVEQIVTRYPSIKLHLLDSRGNLRRYFNIFVNGRHIRDLNDMKTPVKDEDAVLFMASAAGG